MPRPPTRNNKLSRPTLAVDRKIFANACRPNGQIALSMTLLVAAGLFTRSLVNVSRVDLGIKTDNVVTFAISPQLNGYTPERTAALFERLEDELAAVPGVTGVTSSTVGLFAGSNWGNNVMVQGFAAVLRDGPVHAAPPVRVREARLPDGPGPRDHGRGRDRYDPHQRDL